MDNDTSPPAPESGASFSDDLAQYTQVYLDESEEELDGLVEAILQLEVNPHQADALHKSFRMLHSLKGSSGMLGFEVVGNFAHELEDRFERYRSGEAVLDPPTTTLILKCVDFFRHFLDRLRAGDVSEGDPASLLKQLRELEERRTERPASITPPAIDKPLRAVSVSGGFRIQVKFRAGLQLADLKARLIVSRLSSIGEIIACDPPVDDIHSFEELPLFSLTLVTDRPLSEIRKIANVDGVESVEIESGEITAAAIAQPEAEPVNPTRPAEVPTAPREDKDSTAMQESPAVRTEVEAEKGAVSETLRVEIGRLDRLMNLTGELIVANARFSQLTEELSPLFRRSAALKKTNDVSERLRQRFEGIRRALGESERGQALWAQWMQGVEDDFEGLTRQSELWKEGRDRFEGIREAVDQLTRVSKNLQRGVLNTRMVPVGPLFNRFKRVIRDLSVEGKKQTHLVIQGEKTELDKRMIDALGDPLLHLVRNAIDHGLESPEQRLAAGKSDFGTIVLEAEHRGNNVLIMVRDDGGGINTQKVAERILQRGLATSAQIQEMDEQQIINHIWQPGFSTAETITEISGRGVGMDIVQSAIATLSGTIDVASTPGQGTMFTIRLPLTLAIIHSLLVRFRDAYFSIPIDDVREIVSVPCEQVHAIHRHRTIDVRGQLIPLVDMGGVFTWSQNPQETSRETATVATRVNVVVLQTREKTWGLAVDSLVGRADVVIKSLEENYMPVRGLSGASILGDGAVCLMLDTASLLELATERAAAPSR